MDSEKNEPIVFGLSNVILCKVLYVLTQHPLFTRVIVPGNAARDIFPLF